MKKSLVLAMAMALGVTASAYAANPFSDVPAGHWAYDSIDKLAAAGVIDGMGDGTYQGDKTMTRYEMAQIVAKAMAKGANVDKLAAEFADELDNLGVRVANLEKKADNVKIAGTIKASAWSTHGSAPAQIKGGDGKRNTNHKYRLRTDLFINGKVNENWQYNMTMRNEQYFDNTAAGKGEENVAVKDAYVTGRLGGVNVTAGRYAEYLEDGDVLDDRMDGIKVSYGKKIKLTAGYGQYGNTVGASDNVRFARVDSKIGVVGVHAGYYQFKDATGAQKMISTTEAKSDDDNIFAAGINMPVAKNLSLAATYLRTNTDSVIADDRAADTDPHQYRSMKADKDGYTVALNYKGANRKKVGSWGLAAKYYDLPEGIVIAHTMDGAYPVYSVIDGENGFKGVKVGGAVTLAQNIVWSVDYYGLEGKGVGRHFDTLYTMLRFDF